MLRPRAPVEGALTFLVAAWISAVPASAQEPPTQALDSTRNNYVLPAGSETVPLGRLGEVVRRGSGPIPMILVPGHGFSASVFDDFMAANAERYSMWAVTLPGFGGTAPPPLPPESSSYMDLIWTRGAEQGIADLIRTEGIDRPAVVGHFLTGGQVALRLALDHPDRVRAVVVLAGEARRELGGGVDHADPRRFVVDEHLRKKWFKWVTPETWVANNWPARYFARDPEVGKRLRRQSNADPLPVLVQYLAEFFASDVPAEYDRLVTPALVLLPGFTPEFLAEPENASAIDFFQKSWDGAVGRQGIQVQVVDGASIFLWKDEPKKTYEAIAAFLRGVESRTRP